ncbi:MAG TPA: 2Fe-2S iron-sulfur cluster-binding protein [Mycobacteriales bacterium]|jgi:ring-1,2-phenylacetyl-CoA epoxidase subunit PaaE|nr:2Fe-2S iron-sulfur cluster-binding protein [Mycobacteriales bacterium]
MARTYYPLRVAEVRRETADTVSVALEVPDELREVFRFSPGQFVGFRVVGPGGKPVTRSYSISSGLDDGELRVVVKHLPGGVFGTFAGTTLAAGDVLETLAPMGRFTVAIDPSKARRYLGLAAGSGIGPVMSVLRSTLAREPSSEFTLVYGNRTATSTIFRDALLGLKDRYVDRLTLINLFSREQQAVPLLNGRLTDAKLRDLAATLLEIPSYDHAFVCGPEPMTVTLRDTLRELGMPADRVHMELFGVHGAPGPDVAAVAGEHDVRLSVTLSGTTSTIATNRSATVLDAVAAAGLDAPYSCTGGVCATCRAKVVTGSVEMKVNYALEPWELDAGFVLTCQSLPTTDQVTIDYDAV